MKEKELINTDELADLLSQMGNVSIPEPEMSEEMKASQRRYEEIIKKHKSEQ